MDDMLRARQLAIGALETSDLQLAHAICQSQSGDPVKKIAYIVAAFLTVAANFAQAERPEQSNVLVDSLSRCLAVPEATITECAEIAGSVAGISSIKVTTAFDLTAETNESSGPTHEVECEGNTCTLFECDDKGGTSFKLCMALVSCSTNGDGGVTCKKHTK